MRQSFRSSANRSLARELPPLLLFSLAILQISVLERKTRSGGISLDLFLLSIIIPFEAIMPMYELFCISRAQIPVVRKKDGFEMLRSRADPCVLQNHTKNLMRKTALLVMQNGGVVRRLRNFDEQELAYKIRKDHEWFRHGR